MGEWFYNLSNELSLDKPNNPKCDGCNKACFLSCKIFDEWIHRPAKRRKDEKIENVVLTEN